MIQDNGGSRSGVERRQFDDTESTPERRSGKERRKGFDRRRGLGQRRGHHNPGDLLPIERRDEFRGIKAGVQKENFTSSGVETSD
jgi:hypothetical protein